MARAAEKYSDFCIVTSDNPRGESESEIIADILSGFENPSRCIAISQRDKAIEYAISIADKNDLVAIVGKGHERYLIDKSGYHKFDEREII